MKIYKPLFAVVALCGVGAFHDASAHKVGNGARIQYALQRFTGDAPGSRAAGQERFLPVVIRLAGADTPAPDMLNVLNRRGALVIATVAESRWDELAGCEDVERVESSVPCQVQMDIARQYCNFSNLCWASDRPTALSGKGVVTGLVDVGVDFGHINFMGEDGKPRFRRWVNHDMTEALPAVTDSGDEMLLAETDDNEEMHGTHTAGILAGYYKEAPYTGICPKSDIVVSTGPLYDAYLLNGCEEIVKYAAENHRPAVISMSISNYVGPHDGSSLFCRYIDEIASEVPVFLAVGNENPRPGGIMLTSIADAPLRTYITGRTNRTNLSTTVDIWGADDRTFVVKLLRYDDRTSTVLRVMDTNSHDNPEGEWMFVSEDMAESFPGHEDTFLPEGITGYVYVAAEKNGENGRYNVSMRFETKADDASGSTPEGLFGIEIERCHGAAVEVFSDGNTWLERYGDPGAMGGEPDGVISSMCSAKKVVGVGAFVSNDQVSKLSGKKYTSYFTPVNAPASFSSYATKLTGCRRLPDLSAPGSEIVSSMSGPYVAYKPDAAGECTSKYTASGKDYYYYSTVGTSMSTPYVAGMAALLLEAVPQLSPADVTDALLTTLAPPLSDTDNPQWGGGIPDFEAALEKARQLGGVPTANVAFDHEWRLTATGDGMLHVSGNNLADASVGVYDLQGRVVAEISPSADGAVDLNLLQQGVYVARLYVAGTAKAACKVAL